MGEVIMPEKTKYIANYSCEKFVEILSSKAPFPGGGGASALVGAIGIALGNMVGSLTVGKPKYSDIEAEILCFKRKADNLQAKLLLLIDDDAKAFEALTKAYTMPKDTIEQQIQKAQFMESALKDACYVPIKIMQHCCEAIELIEKFALKGVRIALSDAGIGAIFCKAALHGASLNVFINTKLMINRDEANNLNVAAEKMIQRYGTIADNILAYVNQQLR